MSVTRFELGRRDVAMTGSARVTPAWTLFRLADVNRLPIYYQNKRAYTRAPPPILL